MVQALCKAGKVENEELRASSRRSSSARNWAAPASAAAWPCPHTKHPSVDRLVGSVAVSPQGVDFASLDGEVVHLFFLLISPPDRPGDHLRALENISRQLRDDTFCRFLKQAKSVEDIQPY